MKAIIKGVVYEAIPDTNGLLFSYLGKYTPEGDLNVKFKMLNFNNSIISVDKDIYALSKFGPNYNKVLEHCSNYVTAKSLILNEGKVFLVNMDGSAFLFDGDGEVMWTGSLKYKNKVPAAITVCGDGLWGTFPDFDCLVRFNTATMREELRIGKKGDIFHAPKGVFVEDNTLYVASFGGKKVLRVDLPDYTITEMYKTNEKVYSYVRGNNREFLLLESGLYEI